MAEIVGYVTKKGRVITERGKSTGWRLFGNVGKYVTRQGKHTTVVTLVKGDPHGPSAQWAAGYWLAPGDGTLVRAKVVPYRGRDGMIVAKLEAPAVAEEYARFDQEDLTSIVPKPKTRKKTKKKASKKKKKSASTKRKSKKTKKHKSTAAKTHKPKKAKKKNKSKAKKSRKATKAKKGRSPKRSTKKAGKKKKKGARSTAREDYNMYTPPVASVYEPKHKKSGKKSKKSHSSPKRTKKKKKAKKLSFGERMAKLRAKKARKSGKKKKKK